MRLGWGHRAGRRDKNPYLCRDSNFSLQPILQFRLALPTNAYICTLITLYTQDRLRLVLQGRECQSLSLREQETLCGVSVTAHVRSGVCTWDTDRKKGRRSCPHAQEVRGVSYEKWKRSFKNVSESDGLYYRCYVISHSWFHSRRTSSESITQKMGFYLLTLHASCQAIKMTLFICSYHILRSH